VAQHRPLADRVAAAQILTELQDLLANRLISRWQAQAMALPDQIVSMMVLF
jgi:hypothetical protein